MLRPHAAILLGALKAVVLSTHQAPPAMVVRVAVPLAFAAQVVGAPVPIHEAVLPAAVHVGADIGAKFIVAVVPAAHCGPHALSVSVTVPLPHIARPFFGAEVPGIVCVGVAKCGNKHKYPEC